jgi:hypothetical protein
LPTTSIKRFITIHPMVLIYILTLEKNKYYVGKTNSPNFRIEQHFANTGSAWTKKYKPIAIQQLIENSDDFDEDKHVLKLMTKYGIDNVRGGSFSRIALSDANIETIKQMIYGSTDKCFICGDNTHFANACKNKNTFIADEQCDCVNSYFSKHRKSKCFLENATKMLMELLE